MATNAKGKIEITDLDFDAVKSNFQNFLSQQSQFTDYNFEGSGLSNILDVLAYNTHLNGLIANLAVNESFLNSSQLRSSVVSHAENLGYSPKSKTASKATVNLSLATIDTVTATSATGNITAFASDIRLKTEIKPIENAVAKLLKLNGFTYELNELAGSLGYELNGERYSGVSAQEVKEVLPEAVKPAPINSDYMTVQYEKLVPLLIEAIKELKSEIDELKK